MNQGIMSKLITIVAVLLLLVGVFMLVNYQSTKALQEEKELQEEAAQIAATDDGLEVPVPTGGTEVSDAVEETPQAEAAPAEEASVEDAAEEGPTVTPTETPVPEEPDEEIAGVSIRGDDFMNEGDDPATSYPAVLAGMLADRGITVEDNTWVMAGSLSQMRLAGVPAEVAEAYIESHEANAIGELALTEVQVRADVDEVRTERTDLNYVPVIMMGYYGGWGSNANELVEQIQRILDTYEQKDKYIVVGYYPSDPSIDEASYDNAQSEAFGEHYLGIGHVSVESAMSVEGRAEIAQRIYDKMAALGYIEG